MLRGFRALPARVTLTAASLGAVAVLAGCGAAGQGRSDVVTQAQPTATQASAVPAIVAHPQAVDPAAGGASTGTSTAFSVTPAPGTPLAQPTTLAEVRAQLAASGLTANNGQATLTGQGLAIAPVDAPQPVQEMIDAGNEIAHLPYIWGGGHGRYIDTGYDCSGSLSFILAAAGILNTTMTSGELAQWGKPGPGKWVTIFANGGHTFAYIAGLRFDTVALAETGTRWSNRSADEPDLSTFAVRHPPGL